MAMQTYSTILNTAAGAAPLAIASVRSDLCAAIKADGMAKRRMFQGASELADKLSFRSLIAPGQKVSGSIESLDDEAAYTAGLLLVLDGLAQKLGRTKDTAMIPADEVETLRFVVEQCDRSPEAEDRPIWEQHRSTLYSHLAWLRNTLWSIQDPATFVLFSAGTGAATKAQRARFVADPANAAIVKKHAGAVGAKGGPKGGKVNGQRSTPARLVLNKTADPVDVLKACQQMWGGDFPSIFGEDGPIEEAVIGLAALMAK